MALPSPYVTAAAAPVTTPVQLVKIHLPTPIYLSSFGEYSHDGQSWIDGVEVPEINAKAGAAAELTVVISNEDRSRSAWFDRSSLDAEVEVFSLYVDAPNDVIRVFHGRIKRIPTISDVIPLELSTLGRRAENTPRHRLYPPLINHMSTPGAVIPWGGQFIELSSSARSMRALPLNAQNQGANFDQATIAASGDVVRLAVGECLIGGQVANVTTDTAGNLLIRAIWCAGEVESIDQIYLDDEPLPAGVEVHHYTGTAVQGVDSWLQAAITGYADTLRNGDLSVAYSVIKFPPGTEQRDFSVSASGHWLKVHDPRTGQAAWSDNPALMCAWLITNSLHGQGKTVDWDSVTAAANVCDELLSSEKRRTIGLLISQQSRVSEWVQTLADYAGVYLEDIGGTVSMIPDRPGTSIDTITDDDILNGVSTGFNDVIELPTVVRVMWTDTSVIPNEEAQAVAQMAGVTAGTLPYRETVINLPGIRNAAQAQREALQYLARSEHGGRWVEWVGFDDAVIYNRGDIVTLNSVDLHQPLAVRIIEKHQTSVSAQNGLTEINRYRFRAEEYSDLFYSDSTAGAEIITTAPPPIAKTIAKPTLIEIDSGEGRIIAASDGSNTHRMAVQLTPPADPYYLRVEVDFRVNSSGDDWQAASVTNNIGYCSPVADLTQYEIRYRAINAFGYASDWWSASHTTSGKSTAPPSPESITVSIDGAGNRTIGGTYSNRPADFRGFDIEHNIGGAWTSLFANENYPRELPFETSQIPSGSGSIRVTAVDNYGNRSSAAYASNVSIPATPDERATGWDTEISTNYTYIGNVETVANAASALASSASSAAAAANDNVVIANNNAASAVSSAATANDNADAAAAAAGQAQTTASNANQIATNAELIATNAEQSADNAELIATNAGGVATNAENIASLAQNQANTATGYATYNGTSFSNYYPGITSGISGAQSTANTADYNAGVAYSTANTAQSTANTAQSTANTANSNAGAALTTAQAADWEARNGSISPGRITTGKIDFAGGGYLDLDSGYENLKLSSDKLTIYSTGGLRSKDTIEANYFKGEYLGNPGSVMRFNSQVEFQHDVHFNTSINATSHGIAMSSLNTYIDGSLFRNALEYWVSQQISGGSLDQAIYDAFVRVSNQ